ncbi:MAG TPA: TraR/DksA C4-type zinc finger protein [Bacillota bacterium]
MISAEQLQKCKKNLMQRQSELIQQARHHFGTSVEFAQESSGELSNYDNHPADTGTELFERGKDIALHEHVEKELEDINKALHAIEEGTYGICIVCGADIPYERLVAIPTTSQCREHADDHRFKHHRPVEEQVLHPNANPDEAVEDDEKQTIYDREDAWQEVSEYGTSETPSDLYGDRDDYNAMYTNSDENKGHVENVEHIASSNRQGLFTGAVLDKQTYVAEDKTMEEE